MLADGQMVTVVSPINAQNDQVYEHSTTMKLDVDDYVPATFCLRNRNLMFHKVV